MDKGDSLRDSYARAHFGQERAIPYGIATLNALLNLRGPRDDSLRDSYARAYFRKKEADNCAMSKTLSDCFEVLRYRLQIDVIVVSQYFK